MRKSRLIGLFTVAACIAIALTTAVTSAAGTMSTAGIAMPKGTATAQGGPAIIPPKVPQPLHGPPAAPQAKTAIPADYGVPMVKPTIANADANQPLITAQDVRARFEKETGGADSAKIVNVSFMTIGQVYSAGLGGFNFTDDQLLSVVEMSGEFHSHGAVFTKEYVYLNARNGNMIGYEYAN